MKRLLLLLLSLVALASFGQSSKKHREPPPPDFNRTVVRNNTTAYSLSRRLAIPPFREAAQVRLFSFRLADSSYVNDTLFLSLESFRTSDNALIRQSVGLTLPQIDVLTDVVFNECHRYNFTEVREAACYSPHNGVLFLDRNGQPAAFWEICFDCHQLKVSAGPKPERLCDQGWERLKALFTTAGLATRAQVSARMDRRLPPFSQPPDTTEPARMAFDQVTFGIYHGECAGRCAPMFRVARAGEEYALYADTLDTYFSGKVACTVAIRDPQKVAMAVQAVAQLPEWLLQNEQPEARYGCPDCGDGGGIYLEVARGNRVRRYRIDYQLNVLSPAIREMVRPLVRAVNQLDGRNFYTRQ